MAGVVPMEKQELFSALRRVFNVTEYNRGKLGEAVKTHEECGQGNWFFVQSSKGITSAIIPFKELEQLVEASELLERLMNAFLYRETIARLGASEGKIGFAEAMSRLGIDPQEVTSLVESVEFE
ncbi:MAG: hypothetical protein AB1774_06395 [Bacillota bacterium]